MNELPRAHTQAETLVQKNESHLSVPIFLSHPAAFLRAARRFAQFGLVGGSGIVVDMAVLFLLADVRTLNWDLSVAKVIAAETAMFNNFVWNELWTFRDLAASRAAFRARLARFAKFNLICAAGLALNVPLLNLQVHTLGMNMYLANLIAIILVSLWNFAMNLKFGWGKGRL